MRGRGLRQPCRIAGSESRSRSYLQPGGYANIDAELKFAGGQSVPSTIFGLSSYLVVAIACLALVLLIGALRGGLSQKQHARGLGVTGPPRAAAAGLGGAIQMLASVLGILSFAMQVLQWLKII
jgi:hypothetical protein